jgi:predicted dehydrogenase
MTAGAVLLFMDFMDGMDTMDREPNGLRLRAHIVHAVHIVHEPGISRNQGTKSEKQTMSMQDITRRAFLAAATTTAVLSGCATGNPKPNTAKVVPGKLSPNEKLNIAAIGAGGKGAQDILSLARENIVALCDVDLASAAEAIYRQPNAKQYQDYRKMLDELGGQIDAVTVSTPDHTHAPAAYTAMKMGKHVYVQKPLTHTVAEARLLARTAREMKVMTQMGNQGHSGDGVRDLAEMLWAGAAGNVHTVHVWTNRPGVRWPQGGPNAPMPGEPVPETMAWDLWLGTAAERPFSKAYAPRKWRGWIPFGCGGLGDMGCHIMDPAVFALKLNEAKSFAVETVHAENVNTETWPANFVVKYSFPARGDMPPLEMFWYENGQKPPRPDGVPDSQKLGDGDNGALYIGDKGILTTGEYGGDARLLPDEKMKDYARPAQTLERVQGGNHYRNFAEACRTGKPAVSNFDYAAPFTEMLLFGNIAVLAGKKVEYDREKMRVTSDPAMNSLLTKEYRKGWELPV